MTKYIPVTDEVYGTISEIADLSGLTIDAAVYRCVYIAMKAIEWFEQEGKSDLLKGLLK